MTSVSSASKSEFLTSSLVIRGRCNFSCGREERMKASPRASKPRPSANGAHPYRKRTCLEALRLATAKLTERGTGLSILRTLYQTQNLQGTNTDRTGFHTCKECHKTESLSNHTATDHKEGEQLEDQRSFGASSCNSGDGTDQRVQFWMMMMKNNP